MQALWARMQVELLDPQRWSIRVEQLANAAFEYLEVFHNSTRRNSALGMRTPVEYGAMTVDPVRLREIPLIRLHRSRGRPMTARNPGGTQPRFLRPGRCAVYRSQHLSHDKDVGPWLRRRLNG